MCLMWGTTRAALIGEMEAYFGDDDRRIRHAHRVTDYAQQLLRSEAGDRTIVIAAAVLHDIGIHEAERKHGSTGGKFQEMEGPPIARRILTGLGFGPEGTDEVCDIIGHHHSPGHINTANFAILYDADWLANLRDDYDIHDRGKLSAIIDRVFLTPSGRSLARRLYLSPSGHHT